jgi:thiol-disulfide isomerase/thioredoxin
MRIVAALVLITYYVASAGSAESQKAPKNSSVMAAHYGKGTPPISPLTGMDNKPFLIDSLHGHWTLLYYWADWCVPCIEEGIPSLTSFVNDAANNRSDYRIVAIRFNGVDEAGDWNTFHSKTERLERTLWHGVPPFPIVYDSTTRMTSDWGIHELPTYALIDPQGNLVSGGDLSKLRERVRKRSR